MKKPHFFAAKSRLGLINPPHGSKLFNYGVEIAPDFILAENFLSRLNYYQIDSFAFSKPEEIPKDNYQKTIAQESLHFASLINKKLKSDETQIVIGGDHSVAFGSVLALLSRYKSSEIAYIHIDSHADTSSMADSPSQNFHGQFLRALIDENFDNQDLNNAKKASLSAKNTLIIGDLENDDFDFINEAHIGYENGRNINSIINKIETILEKTKHTHLSFDMDVFSQKIVSATGTPNHWGGLNQSHIFPILQKISKQTKLSIDLVEVNPQKEGAIETITLAQEILRILIQ